MQKPPDIATELALIQRELAESMAHCRAIPLEIGHPQMTLAFYKVECCRTLLNRLQLDLAKAERPPRPRRTQTYSPPVSVLTS